MRRFLVLALTLALGLTALTAVPASAGSRDDNNDEDCTYVLTDGGRECLTDLELRQLRDRDKDNDNSPKRDVWQFRDHDNDKTQKRDKSPKRDVWQFRDHDNDKTHKRDKSPKPQIRLLRDRDNFQTPKRDKSPRPQIRQLLLRELRSNASCGCLTRSEVQRLLRLAVDPDRRDVRQILRVLYRNDCFSDSEFRRLRRNARNLDGADLRRLINKADDCGCSTAGNYWLTRGDLVRLDRHTSLNRRTVRQLLQFQGDRDCVTRVDIQRLDRRASDLDFADIFDLLGGYGRL
jgi:hypothetical protein